MATANEFNARAELLSALYEAVNHYRDAMRPFLIRCLSVSSYGDVEAVIRQSLSEGLSRQFDETLAQSEGNLEAAIDVSMFARLVRSNWSEVFRQQFNNASWERTVDTMGVIGGARNEVAHPPPEGLDYEYVVARLYDIADMLERIDAVGEKQAVAAIKDRIVKRPFNDSPANDEVTAGILRQATEKQRMADESIRKAEEREKEAAKAIREAEARTTAAEKVIRDAAVQATKPLSTRREPFGRIANTHTPSSEELWQYWQEVLRRLGRVQGVNYNIGALLRDCRRNAIQISADGNALVLPFSNLANLERMLEELANPDIANTIAQAIQESFGDRYGFEMRLSGNDGGPVYAYPRFVQDNQNSYGT